jgi:invasion protein IalB
MRFNRYIIATCAAALLAVPAPVLADDAAPAAPAAPAAAAEPAASAAATEPAAPATPAATDGAPAAAAPAAPAAAAPAAAATAAPAVREVPEAVKAWAKFCDPDPKDGHQVCIVRKLAFENTSIMGSFVLRLDSAKGVPTLAVAAVPVGVVLKPGLRWQIDTAKPQTLPYWRCTAQSCESEQLVKADFINRLRKGKTLKLIAKDVANKDLSVSFSLAGFSAAYDLKDAPTFEAYAKSLPH